MLANEYGVKPSSTFSYALQKSKVIEDKLIFDEDNGFDIALQDGFFLVKIPDGMTLRYADMFAKNFYKEKQNNESIEDKYRGYRDLGPEVFGDPLLGFHQRKYQIEQFLLEKRFWNQYYTPELSNIGYELCRLSSIIVRSVMEKVEIPKECWDKATGGCTNADGSYHFTFNHFRPAMDTLGLQAHQDDGFITILRSIDPGLEIYKGNEWIRLEAEPEYFKINFGLTMQILTKNSKTPVSAVLHRVIQQKNIEGKQDRWSWGHFSSCRFGVDYDRGIYIYNSGVGLEFYSNAREHINKNDSDIYK